MVEVCSTESRLPCPYCCAWSLPDSYLRTDLYVEDVVVCGTVDGSGDEQYSGVCTVKSISVDSTDVADRDGSEVDEATRSPDDMMSVVQAVNKPSINCHLHSYGG